MMIADALQENTAHAQLVLGVFIKWQLLGTVYDTSQPGGELTDERMTVLLNVVVKIQDAMNGKYSHILMYSWMMSLIRWGKR